MDCRFYYRVIEAQLLTFVSILFREVFSHLTSHLLENGFCYTKFKLLILSTQGYTILKQLQAQNIIFQVYTHISGSTKVVEVCFSCLTKPGNSYDFFIERAKRSPTLTSTMGIEIPVHVDICPEKCVAPS